MATAAYHHGDLRNALLDAAVDLLAAGGPDALSLRAVARAAGVSHAAPYHHFADKAEMIEAVTIRGFEVLAAHMREAATSGGEPLDRFRASGLAYARFAFDHVALFRLMNRSELRRGASVAAAAEAGYQVVEDAVRASQAAGQMGSGDPGAYARASWAMVHGAVMLCLDGLVEESVARAPQAFLDEVTLILGSGLIPRDGGPDAPFTPGPCEPA